MLQTFGTMKSRYRCLHKIGGALQYKPLNCAKIFVSCVLLHNYCVQRRGPFVVDEIELADVLHATCDLTNAARQGQREAVMRELVQNVFTR